MTRTVRIAIVEDEDATNNVFRDLLQEEYPGSTIRQFFSLEHARLGLRGESFDLVLLDIELGEAPEERVGGLALAPLLQESKTPVIIVSATAPELRFKPIITALYAWDYLEKPIDELEFLSKVRAVLDHLRASAQVVGTRPEVTADPDLLLSPLGRQRVLWKGQAVTATITHIKIIKLLVDNHDTLVGYDDLKVQLASSRETHTLRVNINKIRSNFRDVDDQFDRIRNVTARGYMWQTNKPSGV